jgi:hypothetical protein
MPNPHREADRDQIREYLLKRGWSLTPNGELCDTAELQYDNGKIGLRVEHFDVSDERAFNLFVVHPDGRELVYMVEYEDKLANVLDTISSFQKKITPANVGTHLEALHEASQEMYLYRDGDIVPLSEA